LETALPTEDAAPPSPQDVVDFWFGTPGTPEWLQTRPEWFRKDDAFDALIESRFGGLLDRALHGKLDDEPGTQDLPVTRLARILVCDQFSRNVWRGRPKAFALDPIALATSRTLIDTPDERAMPTVQRIFVYMPLMHSEVLADQERCVALYKEVGEPQGIKFAEIHRDIIAKFGRFPHRNPVLGRDTTAEEQAFLDNDGFAG
jgi:uncharacterized protein (DUF924 family)